MMRARVGWWQRGGWVLGRRAAHAEAQPAPRRAPAKPQQQKQPDPEKLQQQQARQQLGALLKRNAHPSILLAQFKKATPSNTLALPVLIGLRRRGDAHTALRVFHVLKQTNTGQAPNPGVLRTLGSCLLNTQPRNERRHDAQSAARSWARLLWREALDLQRTAEGRKLDDGVVGYVATLCKRARDPHTAVQVLRAAAAREVCSPSRTTWVHLLDAATGPGPSPDAGKQRRARRAPNAAPRAAPLVDEGLLDAVRNVLAHSLAPPPAADAATPRTVGGTKDDQDGAVLWNALVQAYARCGLVGRAIALLGRPMLTTGQERSGADGAVEKEARDLAWPTAQTIATVLASCSPATTSPEQRRELERWLATALPSLAASTPVRCSRLCMLARCGEVDSARALLAEMDAQAQPLDRNALTELLALFANAGDGARVVDLHSRVQRTRIALDASLAHALVGALCRCGQTRPAAEVVRRAGSMGVRIDEKLRRAVDKGAGS